MLRTRRTLVLPAHVNITAITNSYDVIHSWFIPGLGLKMDCIPGRATHHTFYIDNVGFYYDGKLLVYQNYYLLKI
jgi:heme/copper-type cytochrome/quinol oxidase subunit 2